MKSDDSKGSANEMVSKAVDGGKGQVAQHGSDLGAAAQDYVSAASDTLSDLHGAARSTISDAADRLSGSASDAFGAGNKAYQAGSERLGRQVSKQPLEALLLAGAIGYLVGWATNRG